MLRLQTNDQMPVSHTSPQGQFLQFHCDACTDYAFTCAPPTTHSLVPTQDLSPADFDTPTVYQYSEASSPSDSLPPSPLYEDYPETQHSSTAEPPRRLRSGNRIPRPRNAFMIFRSEFWAGSKISKSVEHDHRHISRIIGHCWNQLPEEEKDVWRRRAEQEKIEHSKKYPGYRFSPHARTKQVVKRKVKRNGDDELLRCKQVAELLLAGKAGTELDHAVKTIDSTSGREKSQPVPKKKKAACALSECNDAPVFRSPLLPPTEPQANDSAEHYCTQVTTPSSSPEHSQAERSYSPEEQAWTPPYAISQFAEQEASYTSRYQLPHPTPSAWISQQAPNDLSYAAPQVDVYHNTHPADASYTAHPNSSPYTIEFINPFGYHVDHPQPQGNMIQPPVDPLHWAHGGH
ncbi:putative high mobility group [Lyophyllum shimeji]|uniref:High mobility group n=1 Tax=Lyophyllum shimeji TaxID=47721 RepID=A0A9P3PI45_LYOSH|nr:putative high mobility group [Lyophyllum shimeji]